jgi:hypothetical protein
VEALHSQLTSIPVGERTADSRRRPSLGGGSSKENAMLEMLARQRFGPPQTLSSSLQSVSRSGRRGKLNDELLGPKEKLSLCNTFVQSLSDA